MDLYHYDHKNIRYNLEPIIKNNNAEEFGLTYDSPYQTGLKSNDTVYARLLLNKETAYKENYIPGNNNRKNKSDLLILIHGFSTSDKKLKKYYRFLNKMNSRGLSTIFLNLPFHLNRTPEGEKSGDRLIYFDDLQTLLFFHQSVLDIIKLIDIAHRIININNIFICGASLGSMISLIAMANDKRIDKGVFLIGGGNWEEIHWKGALRFILRGNCIYRDKEYRNYTRRKACSEIYSHFPEFMEEIKKLRNKNIRIDLQDTPELKKATKKMCFLCDPLAFAHKIKPENVMMINSRLDFYFSRKSTNQLWEELGKPEIHWLNSLHSSKILNNRKIFTEINNFLQST
ncbi:MAG: alpha/beta hydrolase family protein [Actinomycetota bacterium]|nr:alpha/beta hydrolase family protein [Actinomycetota bacterium]